MSPAGGQQTSPDNLVEHATCLGCGCTCDDIAVHLDAGRIVAATNACELGVRWFGDGAVPATIRVDGRESALADALTAIVDTFAAAREPLVYLAPEISCEAQREGIALADRLRATLDTISSATALTSILAAQERGRTGATLGEIRNRADVIVFWGVDPLARYPRYWSRYAPEPEGLYVGGNGEQRRVIAVDVGDARGPADVSTRIAIGEGDEVALLTAATALIRKPGTQVDQALAEPARQLAALLSTAQYVAIVADGEPPSAVADAPHARSRDPLRAAGLIALAQALNGPTRCALSTLRGGGNRSGAEAVLTAHTGYPTGVSFAAGYPHYQPESASEGADTVLIIGDASHLPGEVIARFTAGRLAIIGPRASNHPAAVVIDTGVAGIHLNGTVVRMDDVPLRVRPSVHRGLDPAEVVRALRERLAQ